MAHKHSLYDTDPHFTIEPATRALKNASMTKTAVIQHDHNSERFTFEIPRYVEEHDMSLCDLIEVHFCNINTLTKEESKGVYPVTDMQICPDDDEVVVLSWLISRAATKYVGSLNFLIRFACKDPENPSEITYAWNTAIYTGISVSSGIYNGEAVVEEYADVLLAWKAELEAQQITDVAQTKASEESGGENIWTATFGDGRTAAFVVRNGKRGAAGAPSCTAEIVNDVLVVKESGQGGAECLLLKDNETGKAHQLYMMNDRLYVEESEV